MKTITCDICGKTLGEKEIFAVSLREDWFTLGPIAAFRVKLETCPPCAETISQAIADEVKGIKARLAEHIDKQPEAA